VTTAAGFIFGFHCFRGPSYVFVSSNNCHFRSPARQHYIRLIWDCAQVGFCCTAAILSRRRDSCAVITSVVICILCYPTEQQPTTRSLWIYCVGLTVLAAACKMAAFLSNAADLKGGIRRTQPLRMAPFLEPLPLTEM